MASNQYATCDSQSRQRGVGRAEEPARNLNLLDCSDQRSDTNAGEKCPPPADDETHQEPSTYEHRGDDADVIGVGATSVKRLVGGIGDIALAV